MRITFNQGQTILVLLNYLTACLGAVKVMQRGWKGSTVRFVLFLKMIQKL